MLLSVNNQDGDASGILCRLVAQPRSPSNQLSRSAGVSGCRGATWCDLHE